jgi:formate hydrogenlyase subunit 3/multisubunit Na+/H+ antiporter MnhD subunit
MDKITISLATGHAGSVAVAAFLCLAIASFAKAGAMPFHTWIPDMAEVSPIPVTAFLPASLDKLLGIYLLTRICMDLFRLGPNLNLLLLIVGSVTIVAAVFMAMIQHDMKKLLSYHAVSQVGYMVLGIGTGTVVGIAGGVFHMLNNTIYKSCLFLCGGAVEHKVGHTDLDKLGGLAKFMPVTFFACLVASLSISGVPPFNGFVSKWMIYQGIIQAGGSQGSGVRGVWWIFLVAAMFGSVLTLASFMKLIHATFLGRSASRQPSTVNETHWTMWLPMGVLALLCIIFGIFAYQLPLKHFILPAVSGIKHSGSLFSGLWQPGMATVLMLGGIVIGFLIYLLGSIKVREDTTYIGGESLPDEDRVTGTNFYQTVKDIGGLKQLYRLAEKKLFDIYDWGTVVVRGLGRFFSIFHTGSLHVYLSWSLIGIVVLLWVMLW